MEKIFSSSKLFNSYSYAHQSKIRAAAGDNKNAELVKQLVQYLDEEYRKPEYVNPTALKKRADPSEETNDTEAPSESTDYRETVGPSGSTSQFSSPSSKRPFTDATIKDAAEGDEDDSVEDVDSVYVQEESSSEIGTDEVTEATNILDSEKDYQKLKPMLESSESTAGVSRVAKKDNEVWIYYGDRFNLNNLMSDVVDALNSHGYDELDFNRLARMDNAIVFEIHEK